MEVNYLLHAPTTLPLGKTSPVHTGHQNGWTWYPFWTLWRRKTLLSLPVIEPRFLGHPARSLVSAELSLFPTLNYTASNGMTIANGDSEKKKPKRKQSWSILIIYHQQLEHTLSGPRFEPGTIWIRTRTLNSLLRFAALLSGQAGLRLFLCNVTSTPSVWSILQLPLLSFLSDHLVFCFVVFWEN